MIRSARDGGSISPEAFRLLSLKSKASDDLCLYENCDIESIETIDSKLSITLKNNSNHKQHFINVDKVWLATGR